MDIDWDYVIACSGSAGVGKSTLMNQLAAAVDPKFSYKRNNFYSRSKLKDALWNYESKSFLNADEAINMLYRRDFFEKDQKNILKDLDVVRDRNLALGLLVPNFWDLDSKILNSGRIKVWLYVDRRGKAFLFKPDKNPFNPDPWNRNENLKLLKDWSKGIHPVISPNYFGEIEFEDLPLDEYAKYKANKDERKRQAAEENEEAGEEKDKFKLLRINAILALHKEGLPQYKIAERLGMSKPTVSDVLNSDKVQAMLKDPSPVVSDSSN